MISDTELELQTSKLEEAVHKALDLAALHSSSAEVGITKSSGFKTTTRLGNLEQIEFNRDGSLWINIYSGERRGSASSTDLSQKSIAQAVNAAIEAARYTSSDPCSGLAEPELMAFDAPKLQLYFPWVVEPQEAASLAAQSEQIALGKDRRIVNSEGAAVSSHCKVRVYGNSHGFLKSYLSSSHSLSCCVIAEQGGSMERDYSYTVARSPDDLASSEWVGEEAAQRTLARLGARQVETQLAPVILRAEVATSLWHHFISAISGGNLYRRSSFLLESLGEELLPKWLSITEHPHLSKGLGSAPFDAEGVKTQELEIVSAGRLQTYLLDSYSARQLGMRSSGHSGGVYNWNFLGQTEELPAMIRRMGRGLLVTELMGQGVNMVTGDYSRGASGFWVEHGEIQHPVHGVTIAGNLRDIFHNIAAIGSDIETRSNIQAGSILLESMKIAGS